MSTRGALWVFAIGLGIAGALAAFEKPFRIYVSMEGYDNVPLPSDWQQKSEWVFGRLMYPNHPNSLFGRRGRFGYGNSFDWRGGGTSWTQDYPRADRHFAMAVRRLTRVQARSVEQPVNPDDQDDIYGWPWLCAGEMGDWKLTDTQVATLREYLLRGGFLLLDDFWGPEEFGRFNETMSKVFPTRPIIDIPNDDPVFHAVYDVDERRQLLGMWAFQRGGSMSRRAEGTVARWMGIYDDKNRLMVAINFNSDMGDSWEWADEPSYPEKLSAQGLRMGVNDVVYSMTH